MRERAAERWVSRLGLDRHTADADGARPSVRLLHVDGDEESLLAALRERDGVWMLTTRVFELGARALQLPELVDVARKHSTNLDNVISRLSSAVTSTEAAPTAAPSVGVKKPP